MASARIGELVPVQQVAIGPVILISGIGLLLLTVTNRFGRILDRSRILVLASAGVLLGAVLVIALFVAARARLELGPLEALRVDLFTRSQ